MKILIVGATSDIGFETLKLLATEHEIIATGYLNLERLESISDIIGKSNTIKLDLSKISTITEQLQGLDVDCLINFAGKAHLGLIQDMSVDEWSDIINVNLSSAFAISKAVIPNMIKNKKGKLIFISSIWARVGASYEVAYSAAKGGLNTFVKALAKELAPSNIAVNSIELGMVDTKMNKALSKEDLNAIENDIPFLRFASTQECAIFIKKIIELPNYATGQNIRFDGAWY